jgi:hypothetical protein
VALGARVDDEDQLAVVELPLLLLLVLVTVAVPVAAVVLVPAVGAVDDGAGAEDELFELALPRLAAGVHVTVTAAVATAGLLPPAGVGVFALPAFLTVLLLPVLVVAVRLLLGARLLLRLLLVRLLLLLLRLFGRLAHLRPLPAGGQDDRPLVLARLAAVHEERAGALGPDELPVLQVQRHVVGRRPRDDRADGVPLAPQPVDRAGPEIVPPPALHRARKTARQ